MLLKLSTTILKTLGIATVISVSLTACSEKIDARQTQVAQGLLYKLNTDEPFTGTVENYEMYKLGLSFNHYPCKITLKKGLLNGTATCQSPSGVKVAEIEYSEGKQEGLTQVWDETVGKLIFKTEFHQGQKNGISERYNPNTGSLVNQTHWVDGKKDGAEKIWNITGEILLTDLIWKDGKQTGHVKSGERESDYENGNEKNLHRYTLIDGDYDSQKIYISQKAAAEAIGADFFVPLLGNGKFLDKNLEDHKNLQEDRPSQQQLSQSTVNQSECLDGKITAYHKDKGEEADISNDMIEEWKNSCSK